MGTDEDYLDSLLKNVLDNEPAPSPLIEDAIEPENSEADFVLPEIPSFDEELPIFDEPILEDILPTFDEETLIDEQFPIFDEPFEEEALVTDEQTEEEPLFEEALYEEPLFEEPLFEEPLFEESFDEEPIETTDIKTTDIETTDIEITEEDPLYLEEFDLSVDGIFTESPEDNSGSDGEVTLDDFDIDAILNGMDVEGSNDFEGNDNIDIESDLDIAAQMEDMDIGDLLAGMDDDEDLSDIKDLLDKDDNNELIDDDMLSLLDDMPGYNDGEDDSDILSLFNEADPEPFIESKRKNSKKKKKGKGDNDDEMALSLEDLDAHIGEKRKKGIISRMFAALTESDDESDEIDVKIQSISAENLDILDELKAEDGKDKKITKKDKKAPKEKKEKKPKEKKEKKPKKEKVVKEPEEPEKPVKRVSKKKILLTFIFSTSFLAVIMAFCLLVPDYLEREEANTAFQNEDHKSVFDLLYAKNRGGGDELRFQQALVIMKINRPLESYQTYKSLDKPVEALNALLMGITRYDAIKDENLFGADIKVNSAYQEILYTLSSAYGLSEVDARTILGLNGELYTRRLYELTLGIDFSDVPLGGYVEIATEVMSLDAVDGTINSTGDSADNSDDNNGINELAFIDGIGTMVFPNLYYNDSGDIETLTDINYPETELIIEFAAMALSQILEGDYSLPDSISDWIIGDFYDDGGSIAVPLKTELINNGEVYPLAMNLKFQDAFISFRISRLELGERRIDL